DVEVDLCPKCGGLWLDKGEITKLANMPDPELGDLRAALVGTAGPPPVPSDTAQHCPARPGSLKEGVLGPVHVGYCGNGHGIVLRGGELDEAVTAARAKAGAAGTKQVLAVAAKAASSA